MYNYFEDEILFDKKRKMWYSESLKSIIIAKDYGVSYEVDC